MTAGQEILGGFAIYWAIPIFSVVSKVFSRSVIPGCYQALEGWSRWSTSCFNTDLSFTTIVSKQKLTNLQPQKIGCFLTTSLHMIFGGNIATVVWWCSSHLPPRPMIRELPHVLSRTTEISKSPKRETWPKLWGWKRRGEVIPFGISRSNPFPTSLQLPHFQMEDTKTSLGVGCEWYYGGSNVGNSWKLRMYRMGSQSRGTLWSWGIAILEPWNLGKVGFGGWRYIIVLM